jgi:anhydro-N-acetylmuramic acid kinase
MFESIYKLIGKNEVRILGMMTGTSADGLDLTAVKFKGKGKYPDYEVYYSDFIPYPDDFSNMFKKPLELTPHEIAAYHMKLGTWYGKVISELEIDFDVVANHGQTLLHQPPLYTLQIGEAQCIKEFGGKPVIYDFRTADVMLGGQGAPLIPVLDEFLLRETSSVVVALNMGGIANLTLLPPREMDKPVYAWDTGPANTLIDKAVIDFTSGKELFDRDGRYADSGKLNTALLEFMLEHDYLKRRMPKSAGQEQFGYDYYKLLKQKAAIASEEDWLSFIRTLSELTVMSIAGDIKKAIDGYDVPVKLVASGGGAENNYIMRRLSEELSGCECVKFDLPGVSSDIKEAFGFAYLGYLFLRGLPGNIPTVTGASREAVLGKIVF